MGNMRKPEASEMQYKGKIGVEENGSQVLKARSLSPVEMLFEHTYMMAAYNELGKELGLRTSLIMDL